MRLFVFIPLLLFSLAASAALNTELYSKSAEEYKVSYEAVVKTEFKTLDQVKNFSKYQKQEFEEYVIKPTTKFVFGPLTHRSLGGEQKGYSYNVNWEKAYIDTGFVYIPYQYNGLWLVNKTVSGKSFQLPLPLHYKSVRTQQWKNCTDSIPEHQDIESYWYYWDPTRPGCDNKLTQHYQIIDIQLLEKTQQTKASYPEYEKMKRNNTVKLSFGFGYVEDETNPQPFSDTDYGMQQMRSFVTMARNRLRVYNFKETDILEKEYLGSQVDNRKIGTLFSFTKNGIAYEVKIIAAGSIDQMELFAKSFSHDHDAFFGWFGHSRVGNGFDAYKFASLMRQDKQFYSLTPDYQLVYWAGCNSYSYYTKPFFDFKSNLLSGDVKGTKSLDIISNGLPSYFSLNAANADVLLAAITDLEKRMSYQEIIDRIERQSNQTGIYVLANVLGDEDNN